MAAVLARRMNSLQQLHEVASTTEAHFERQDVSDLLCPAAQRRHHVLAKAEILAHPTGTFAVYISAVSPEFRPVVLNFGL
jgi:hypothetical protein